MCAARGTACAGRDHRGRGCAEPRPHRAHAAPAGAEVRSDAGAVSVAGAERLALESVDVPGDFSSAAFLIVAAALVAGSEVVLRGVGVNPTRTGLLDVMRADGRARRAARRAHAERRAGRGPCRSRMRALSATTVDAGEVPLTDRRAAAGRAAGCFAEGVTVCAGAEELRHKESDRIATVVDGMRALGADIEATEDGFEVEGPAGCPVARSTRTATTGSRCSARSPASLVRRGRGAWASRPPTSPIQASPTSRALAGIESALGNSSPPMTGEAERRRSLARAGGLTPRAAGADLPPPPRGRAGVAVGLTLLLLWAVDR